MRCSKERAAEMLIDFIAAQKCCCCIVLCIALRLGPNRAFRFGMLKTQCALSKYTTNQQAWSGLQL